MEDVIEHALTVVRGATCDDLCTLFVTIESQKAMMAGFKRHV